jgi:hypothetical protein
VSYPNLRLTTGMAAESLSRFKAGFRHISPVLARLTESRQTTDTCLAGLAFQKRGRLATLNGGIVWRAVRNATAELIEKITP